MAGKFLRRDAIIDTVKSEHRTNAIRKRRGLERHPLLVVSCGCPDPACGAFHMIRTERVIPTPAECQTVLKEDSRVRKPAKPMRKRVKPGEPKSFIHGPHGQERS